MSLKNTLEIDIIKASASKIDSIDFENLAFGNVFTDHMLICDFKEGAWQKPIIKPYEPFLIDPSAKVFHYGQAIFEGMKAYKDVNEDVWLFRPDENFHRFNKSAVRMAMPEVPETIFIDGLKTIIDLEREWVKTGLGNTLYIRPFMIAIGSGVIAQPSTQYRFMIILSPAKSYYSGEVKVIIVVLLMVELVLQKRPEIIRHNFIQPNWLTKKDSNKLFGPMMLPILNWKKQEL